MKTMNILIAGALLLTWLPITQAAPPVDKKILPYPIFQKKMTNGLNVVTVPFDSPGLAAFFIVVRAGSRDEIETGKTGFALY